MLPRRPWGGLARVAIASLQTLWAEGARLGEIWTHERPRDGSRRAGGGQAVGHGHAGGGRAVCHRFQCPW